MIKHLALAAVAVGLMTSSSTASIVIDDFDNAANFGLTFVNGVPTVVQANEDLGNGVLRTVSTNRIQIVQLDGGNFQAINWQPAGQFSLSYDLTGSGINRNLFVQNTLEFGFDITGSGSPTFNVDLFATGAGAAKAASASLLGISSLNGINVLRAVSGLDGWTNNSGSLAPFENLDTLTITVTNTAPAGGPMDPFELFTLQTNGTITAVPEPTSIALLGLTGIGGVIAVRRRRKSVSNS